ncbi:hypothetical protein LINGRAPRIM_LOCUS2586, partial [Linum grandiflorum]
AGRPCLCFVIAAFLPLHPRFCTILSSYPNLPCRSSSLSRDWRVVLWSSIATVSVRWWSSRSFANLKEWNQ